MARALLSRASRSKAKLGMMSTELAHLREGNLFIESRQGLLEALNLLFTAGGALLECRWLGNAALLDLSVVLQDCCVLLADCFLVRREFCNLSVECLEFLSLVLDVLILHGLLHLVLLRLLVVGFLSVRFGSFLTGQIFGEVALAQLKDVDNAAAGSTGFAVRNWLGWLLDHGD